jgi:ribosome-binding factor A
MTDLGWAVDELCRITEGRNGTHQACRGNISFMGSTMSNHLHSDKQSCARGTDLREEARRQSQRALRRRHGTSGFHHLNEVSRGADHKSWQLCRQVAHTLDGVLAECGDGALQSLRVMSVVPSPDASRLLVTLTPLEIHPGKPFDAVQILRHLRHATGYLRREVAAAVTRRRTPLLVYQLAEPSSLQEGSR